MNDIQKYRKNSAKWLGYIPKTVEWFPDIDLNQQGMIEDELIDTYKLDLIQICLWHFDKKCCEWIKTCICSIEKRHNANALGYAKKQESKSTAFRLAWMQFYETLEK